MSEAKTAAGMQFVYNDKKRQWERLLENGWLVLDYEPASKLWLASVNDLSGEPFLCDAGATEDAAIANLQAVLRRWAEFRSPS